MRDLGRWLVLAGLSIAVVGALLVLFGRIPWLGRLPGDLAVRRGGVSIFVPLGTCLVLSILLTLLLNLFFRR